MFERFTDRAATVMGLAEHEARRYGVDCVSSAHLLLAIFAEGTGGGFSVLKRLRVEAEQVRGEYERLAGLAATQPVVGGKLPKSVHVKHVIELAILEARGLTHDYVGTEHLLLGLLRHSNGLAARILTSLGLTIEQTRAEVRRFLGMDAGSSTLGAGQSGTVLP